MFVSIHHHDHQWQPETLTLASTSIKLMETTETISGRRSIQRCLHGLVVHLANSQTQRETIENLGVAFCLSIPRCSSLVFFPFPFACSL